MAFKSAKNPASPPPPPPPVEEQTVIPGVVPAPAADESESESDEAATAAAGRAAAARLARLAKKVIDDLTSGGSSSGRADLLPGWRKSLAVIEAELEWCKDEHGSALTLVGRMDRITRKRKLESKIAKAAKVPDTFTRDDFQWALAHFNLNSKLSFADFAGLGIPAEDLAAAADFTPEAIAAYGSELTARRAAATAGQ